MNGLTEPKVIRSLYEASQAGVQIQLIVRGICCLRPGIEGVSENIKVRSVVGRFLEHERVSYFENDGNSEVYCASADWMERNFFVRVETMFPIQDEELATQVVRECLTLYLEDNTQAWEMNADGSYQRVKSSASKARVAQQRLRESLDTRGALAVGKDAARAKRQHRR